MDFFPYQFDIDVVGRRSTGDSQQDGVQLPRSKAERDLVAPRVGPRRLGMWEHQQTTVATNAETITDAFC